MLDEKQIETNWNNLLIFIENAFTGERQDKLLALYNKLSDRIASAPASGRINYHSCFVGGYVHHVLNVLKYADSISKMWRNNNQYDNSYTDEELFFSALNHDLGKIGDFENDYYVLSSENWQIKKGQLYGFNRNLSYMSVSDRSIFLLQSSGIKLTNNEFLAIKLHDGLYDESNKKYFITYDVTWNLRSMLPYVVHFADMLATKEEYYQFLNTDDGKRFMSSGVHNPSVKPFKKQKNKISFEFDESSSSDLMGFDDLFGSSNHTSSLTEQGDDE